MEGQSHESLLILHGGVVTDKSETTEVRHVVYSVLKIVQPRGRKLDDTMKAMRNAYKALAHPKKLDWHGGSWRLPLSLAEEHVIGEFLRICRREGVKAKYCSQDLMETT